MIISYKGQRYDYDPAAVTVKQAMAIEAHTGLSFEKWGDDVGTSNLKALQAFGWLILTGGDLAQPVAETDFEMATLGESVAKAQTAQTAATEAAEAATPGPTAATSGDPVGVNGLVAPSPLS